MSLFEGYAGAHGLYGSDLKTQDNGPKLKAKAYSIREPVTVELWEQHVKGTQALGIIPITEKSAVKFAAIDVDQYPCDLLGIYQQVIKFRLPLLPVRTKSGGVHLFLFLTEFHDAAPIQAKMREFATMLGFGNCEIFPKQAKIIPERGDIGQWINMPYFKAANTDRYCISEAGNPLGVSDFIVLAHRSKVRPIDLLASVTVADTFPGGPPCLNHLVMSGFPEGSRNNALFNLGVYAQKANPDNWQHMLQEYNDKHMSPPLDDREVLGVIHSLNKKTFSYMCKQPPIVNYCNMTKCRQCKHGIGGGTGLPRFGTLSKLMTDPPIWFLEVEGGGRLELTTEELQDQRRFQSACMRALNIMPGAVKRDAWEDIVQGLLTSVTIVEFPPELTAEGILRSNLEDFCLSRAQARNADELLLGKPWLHDGAHYFRMRDFLDFLERRKYRQLDVNFIAMHLMDWGAKKKFFNLKGRGCNCFALPQFKEKQTQKFDPVPFAVPEVI